MSYPVILCASLAVGCVVVADEVLQGESIDAIDLALAALLAVLPGIPLASRIILACDAYHAMSSDRP